MRPKAIILIVVAAGCGLVASIGISQALDSKNKNQSPQVEMEKIFVALEGIDINEVITPEMVRLEEWPKDRIMEGAITNIEDIEDHRPRTRIYAGQPILSQFLFGSDEDRGASKLIPKGFRAHSVRVTAESAASGLILPGDRVDVLVYLRNLSGTRKSLTRTILKNVRVFAVDTHITRETGEGGNSIAAKTVSLLVKPSQVEILMLAGELGTLSLSLRPPDDEVVDDTDDATVEELLGITADADPENKEKKTTEEKSGKSFTDFINSFNAPNNLPSVTPAEPKWTMDILTPEGVKQFQFDEDGRPPHEVGSNSGGFTPPPVLDNQTPKQTPVSSEKLGAENLAEELGLSSPEGE